MPMRGPKCKLGYHRVFNLTPWILYTGTQWKRMPVPRTSDGTAPIHHTTIYKVFAKWADDGSLDHAFIASVRHLAEQHHLDLNILHGDGIGYSGHKHQKGEKIIAIVDNNGYVLAPLPVATANEPDTVLPPKRGRKRLFNAAIHSLRLCVKRTLAWEDKFKRLLLRFEFKQQRHYGIKLMADA